MYIKAARGAREPFSQKKRKTIFLTYIALHIKVKQKLLFVCLYDFLPRLRAEPLLAYFHVNEAVAPRQTLFMCMNINIL